MKKIFLEDCCDILDSIRVPITASDRIEGEYPYYGANGIQGYVSGYIFDDELVLLAEDGGHFGSKDKPIAYRVSGKCWVNNHAHVLKPKEGLDVDYLCYSLMFYNVENIINGATRKKLTQSAMRKMLIPWKEFEEQKIIVEKIKKISSIMENRKKEIEILDTLVNARFVEMFGNIVLNSFNLPLIKLKELSELITKGASPNWQGFAYTTDNTQTLFITSENVRDGWIDLSVSKFVEDGFNLKQKRSQLKRGDVLINIVGASIGRAAWFNKSCKANINQAVALVRTVPNIVNGRYLAFYLNSEKAMQMYLKMQSNTGRANLSLEDIGNIEIIFPPIELQNQFADFVKQVDKSKLAVQKSLEEAQLLFDSLMQEYFG